MSSELFFETGWMLQSGRISRLMSHQILKKKVFCNSFSYYCVKEYEYLKILQQRLQDRLKIITILVDDSFQSMRDLMKNNNYPWTFLHFSNQPQVIDDYDIQTYPSYFLIGPEGKLVLSPAPSPAENFEATFNKLQIE